MKKICFSTLGCIDNTLEQTVALAKKYGIDTLEIRGIAGEMDNTKIECFLPENAEKTKQYLASEGISLLSMGTSACCDAIGDDDEAIEKVCREIDVASRMGFKFVRVFGNNVKEEYSVVCERVVRALTKLCKYASERNVTVCLETHGDFMDIETIVPVLERMKDKEGFALLYDVAHPDKKYKENWMEFYSAVKPFIKHMHIKDHVRDPWKLVDIGKGDIPFVDICNQLEKDGYDGYFSLEWEKKWHPELGDLENVLKDFIELVK